MKLASLLAFALSAVWIPIAPAAPAARSKAPPKAAAAPRPAAQPAAAAPETVAELPDTAVLARVEDRVIRVLDFRDAYYSTFAEVRPARDSAGRAELLDNMVNKEVMALTALAIDRPLGFEDRLTLKAHTRTVLQNVLYQRFVADSAVVTEAEVRETYAQYSYDQRLRDILFDDRATAERVRRDLLAGRITWKEAVAKYSRAENPDPEGDMGWVARASVTGDLGLAAFALEPGAISEVLEDPQGFHLLQCVGRRPRDPLAFEGVRRVIANDLRASKTAPRLRRLYAAVRAEAGVTYDTTNIRWAAARFREALLARPPAGDQSFDLSGPAVPTFGAADTGRVLARSRDRVFTLRDFMAGYLATAAYLRSRVISLEPFLYKLQAMFLEPEIIALAEARGMGEDSMAVAFVERRREQILVEHLYRDSVLRRVSVTPEAKRRHYEDRRDEFVSVPVVRYAHFVRDREGAADSLLARLRAGETAQAALRADSLAGDRRGSILEARQNQPNLFGEILFEELRPGQATKVGPDREGRYAVLHLIHYEPIRPMAYEEVEAILDESVRNSESERLLLEFLARHRGRYRIAVHPERLMRVRLSDPGLDWPPPWVRS